MQLLFVRFRTLQTDEIVRVARLCPVGVQLYTEINIHERNQTRGRRNCETGRRIVRPSDWVSLRRVKARTRTRPHADKVDECMRACAWRSTGNTRSCILHTKQFASHVSSGTYSFSSPSLTVHDILLSIPFIHEITVFRHFQSIYYVCCIFHVWKYFLNYLQLTWF